MSRCGGTKHKATRSGLVVACRSEPSLNILSSIDCGPCQYEAFEKPWKRKLELAERFLECLKDRRMPGVEEVTERVKQLKEEFDAASWKTRRFFPPQQKERCIRFDLGYFEKAPSPLRHEVLREDIPEPPPIIDLHQAATEWNGWDCVASTDPLHPVDVTYVHPFDDDDQTWMLDQYTPEELNQFSDSVGFEENPTTIDNLQEEGTTRSAWNGVDGEWNIGTSHQDSGWHEVEQDSDAEESMSFPTAQDELPVKNDRALQERIDMVIHEFLRVVNDEEDASKHSAQETSSVLGNDLISRLEKLNISDASANPCGSSTGLLTPPQTPPRLMTDGFCDPSHLSQSLLPDVMSSLPSPDLATPVSKPSSATQVSPETAHLTSTCWYNNKWQRHISVTKDTNRCSFYDD